VNGDHANAISGNHPLLYVSDLNNTANKNDEIKGEELIILKFENRES